jgi:ATP-dependent Clp protease, protease subunit
MNPEIIFFIGIVALGMGVVFVLRTISHTASSGEDRLLSRRVVRLRGFIGDASANEVIAKLLYLQQVSPTEPINLFIDSPGGGVSPGLAIVDAIEMIAPPVHTHCEETAGSMALVILMYGRRGNRSVRKTARLSFSMPQAPKEGAPCQKADAERFAGILIGKVVKATGLAEADVRRMFEESMTLDGMQALHLGLVDKTE